MVFSSNIFLFAFLPIVLVVYHLLRAELRNAFLLLASLLFYSWGQAPWVMLVSIAINYAMGLWVQRRCDRNQDTRLVVTLAVLANLGLIIVFKYANFFVGNAQYAFPRLQQGWMSRVNIALPLGISFFTFHAMSYVIDIARRQARAMRNPFDLALYIAFFPQLIAGPIIRYHEIADQYRHRSVSIEGFALGIRKFVVGLAKKMLIANTVSTAADSVFALPSAQLNAGLAWLGIICYALQIYFDFSGYTDMAIGLGRMFGFKFPENFNYPYVATSITDFWRWWHMTLSRWFRDYLYIPLGGNRRSAARTYVNLATVFVLCGTWHGANWTFVIWGLFHGTLLIVERLLAQFRPAGTVPGPGRYIGRAVGHVYALLAILVGWVFFRANNLPQAIAFLKAMAGYGLGDGRAFNARFYLTNEIILMLAAGAIAAMPFAVYLRRWGSWPHGPEHPGPVGSRGGMRVLLYAPIRSFAVLCMFVICAAKVFAGTANPFIYFRF